MTNQIPHSMSEWSELRGGKQYRTVNMRGIKMLFRRQLGEEFFAGHQIHSVSFSSKLAAEWLAEYDAQTKTKAEVMLEFLAITDLSLRRLQSNIAKFSENAKELNESMETLVMAWEKSANYANTEINSSVIAKE